MVWYTLIRKAQTTQSQSVGVNHVIIIITQCHEPTYSSSNIAVLSDQQSSGRGVYGGLTAKSATSTSIRSTAATFIIDTANRNNSSSSGSSSSSRCHGETTTAAAAAAH